MVITPYGIQNEPGQFTADVHGTSCVNEPLHVPPLISWIRFLLFCDFNPSSAPNPHVLEQAESSDHSIQAQSTTIYHIIWKYRRLNGLDYIYLVQLVHVMFSYHDFTYRDMADRYSSLNLKSSPSIAFLHAREGVNCKNENDISIHCHMFYYKP